MDMHQLVHVVVSFLGTCPGCRSTLKEKIYDYGRQTYIEFDQKVGEINYSISKIRCGKCGKESLPTHVEFVELISGRVIGQEKIGEDILVVGGKDEYGNAYSREEYAEIERGIAKLPDVFKENECGFWKAYFTFAKKKWQRIIKDLTREELIDAYHTMGWIVPANASVAALRKQAEQKINNESDREKFWRAANQFLVFEVFLSLGPENWKPEKAVRMYGLDRVRWLILNFPLPEELETMRTKAIPGIVRKTETGDGAALYKRIEQLTKELQSGYRRINKLREANESLRTENGRLREQIGQLRRDMRDLQKQQKAGSTERSTDDIRKIHELKSLIGEMKTRIETLEKEIQERAKNRPDPPVPIRLDETDKEEEHEKKENVLKGKTVAIIGGKRGEQAQKHEFPCNVICHDGEKLDPSFWQTMRQADILVGLIDHIPHVTMWEIKEFSIDHDIPVFFPKHINLFRILDEIKKEIEMVNNNLTEGSANN